MLDRWNPLWNAVPAGAMASRQSDGCKAKNRLQTVKYGVPDQQPIFMQRFLQK